ncbi:MAG: glycosyltransferase family 2 protein, partial [bacterium]|nr:glycosyltransferase family 2 protein [bacterium]
DGKYKINFIFVNDGSTDKTLEILKQEFNKRENVNILALEKNSGFGAALRTGLKAAVSDFVVTIDADTNYDQLEIPKILDYLTDEFDLVTASPFHPDGQWNFPMHRFITSRTVARLYKIALRRRYGSDLSTFTSGFRVYRGKILESIMPTASDFLATAQLLLNAVLKEYRVCEYPTVVYERKFGKSKLKTFQTIISHLKFIFKVFRTR